MTIDLLFLFTAGMKGQVPTRNEGTGHPLKGGVLCPLAFLVPSVPSLSLRCPFAALDLTLNFARFYFAQQSLSTPNPTA